MSERQTPTMLNDWLFIARNVRLYDIGNNSIDANKAAHCFQILTQAFSKLLVQTIL